MKHIELKHVLALSFLVTVVLEMYAVWAGQYTISDFILNNIRLRWRIAICAFIVYHFLFEYPTYR